MGSHCQLAGSYSETSSLIVSHLVTTLRSRPNRLLAMLASWENQSLWKYPWLDGSAGYWIFSGLMQGLLVIGHDGSYMPHLASNVCTCAAVIYCSHTNQYVDITWVEKCHAHENNLCGYGG